MPKEFYTEHDIEDLFKRGTTSLQLNDNVVLTELAYEKARQLGMSLVTEHDTPPAAPIRPYITKGAISSTSAGSTPAPAEDVHSRIKSAVLAKLGAQVDPVLLDAIIDRVLANFTKG